MLFAGSLICAVAGVAQAQAATFSDRDSAYTITFSGGIDTASTLYTVTATMPSGGSSADGYLINFKTGATGMAFSTSGGVTTTFTPMNGAPSETANIDNDGTGGTFGFNYTTANGPDFTTSWTISTIANGHNVLAFGGVGGQGFGGCGSALLDVGGIFTCEVFIQGNHPFGMATGDVYVTNLAAGYSPVSQFYDSGLDETIFSTSTGDYTGVNPGLGLNLVGTAAVPEPATWAMMLIGFGGLGAAMRSRRRSAAATA